MLKKIVSSSNPKIKRVLRLRDAGDRKKESRTLIEGEREILMALDAGIDVQELFVSEAYANKSVGEIIKKLEARHKEIYEAPAKVYQKIAYGQKKEGALAVAALRPGTFADLPRKDPALFVVIEHVEKPGNLGAILRSCDGAGVNGVLICDPATDIYNPNCIRSSLGGVFTTGIVVTSNDKALDFLKERNVRIAASSPSGEKPYWGLNARQPLALVVGSEREGLSAFWLKQAHETLRIPMKGKVDSLNVSVSTAVILYDINRQRSQ
jgi:TrmH family RNA methyltransferase